MSVHTTPTTFSPRLLHDSAVYVSHLGQAVHAQRFDYAAHIDHWGSRPIRRGRAGTELHREVAEVGLTGCGGSHFPIAKKWGPVLAAGPGGTVVINGAEGEPGSVKDAVVLQTQPHLVLDGAMNVAEIIGARDIIIWLEESVHVSAQSMSRAIAERQYSDDPLLPIKMMWAPSGYLSGESTAVIAGVRGEPVAPTHTLDRARPWGHDVPILVHNVETFARVGMLGHTGAGEYPRTVLITLSLSIEEGVLTDRRVVEAGVSDTIGDVFDRHGVDATSWILLGGFAGTWHQSDQARLLPLAPDLLRNNGLSLGAGIVIVVPQGRELLPQAAAIAHIMAGESAGQCGPCVFGLPAVAKALDRGRLGEVMDLSMMIKGRGGCGLPDGVLRMVESAVDVLQEKVGADDGGVSHG